MKVYEILFSPTGGTRKVADVLAEVLSDNPLTLDLMDGREDFAAVTFSPDAVAIIAVPAFGGRVPVPAVERMGQLVGNGARAILVCVYGNRAYEDTLIELEDIARQAGFQVTAAVAAVAEHSILRQYAAGRPDAQDRERLQDFAHQIQEKLLSGNWSEPDIPGNHPYRKPGVLSLVPKPGRSCMGCGLCASRCPVQAIDPADPKKVDASRCISCMRCVAICPQSARQVSAAVSAGLALKLKMACSSRKECELFL